MKYSRLLAIVFMCLATFASAEVKVGDKFPSFKIPTLDGKVLDTAQLQGKVIYADFWASWCTTCIKSFPVMSELNSELKGKGIFFLGINTDENIDLAKKFLVKTPVNFINVSDRTQQIVSYFEPKGFPTAYIVAKDGTIHTIEVGFAGKEKTKALLLELAAQ